jgi:hypothetical protein
MSRAAIANTPISGSKNNVYYYLRYNPNYTRHKNFQAIAAPF